MDRRAVMRPGKAWGLAVCAVAAMVAAELPRLKPWGSAEVSAPWMTARAPEVRMRVPEIRGLQPAVGVSAESVRVWAGIGVPVTPWVVGVEKAISPMEWSDVRVDEERAGRVWLPIRAASEGVDLEWWLTLEPVWSGGPLGRLRQRADQERLEGRAESAEQYQLEYWRAFGDALERRRVFQGSENLQQQRRAAR